MNRHFARVITLAITIAGIALSGSLVSAGPFWGGAPDRALAAATLLPSADEAPNTNRTYTSSIEYQLPDPPSKRTRQYCESMSRLCEWFAHHDSLVSSDAEDRSQDDTDEQDRSPGRTDSDTPSINQSVVGWRSASISTLQQEKSPAPISLEVPSLSILADVKGVGIGPNRTMQVPDDFNTVGWYRHGPSPGDEGSAAIAGHLDDVRGRSVFFDLQHIEVGAEVIIGYEDGSEQRFEVFARNSYDAGNLPSDQIFRRDGTPRLALLTCGGRWDSSAGRYSETVVIYAKPV